MIKQEDPRFRHLKKKITVFTAVAVAVIVGVVVLIGKENDLFTQKYELMFTVDKGTGFNRGMPVKLSGFRIGRIKSISLNETAKVDIVLQIDTEYRKWIRKDSTAKLVKEGLVGDSVIEVSVGNPQLPELKDRERLAYAKTKALDELADELAEKVKPVLMDVKDIIGYMNDPNGDIKTSLRNFATLSGNLELTRQRADHLLDKTTDSVGTISTHAVKAVDQTSSKLSSVLDDTSVTVKRANASLQKVDEKLPVMLGNMESSLKNVEAISKDLRHTEEQVLPKVPAMVRKSDEALDGANTVIKAVKGTWPISGKIPEPNEKQFVEGDSHE
ncbi:MlaD family protein [Geomonas sp. Red32]|uniref:MlaD family protein n=1 Tax=Geomonas sp. Red32 TaxID=2912856 RepID=UPI00202CFC04|nr:MlaD family protein [Geomonas sp. Red32]MCM0083527.1 MlaD family protein [Geomonas sp. Red32]